MALNGRVEDDDAGESVTRGDLFRKMATFTCCSSVVVGALGGGLAASAAAETASKTGARGEVRIYTTD